MPGEIRRVGECAERVLVEHRLAVNEFKYYDASAGLAETPVHCAYSRVEGAYLNFGKAFLHLVNSGEIGEYPADQLHVANAGRKLIVVEFSVLSEAREEEQTCGKSFLVDSVHNEWLVLRVNTGIAITGLEFHGLFAGRAHRLLLVTARNYCVTAVHRGFEPLDRAGNYPGIVFCFQSYARAGICRMDCAGQQERCKRDANCVCSFHNMIKFKPAMAITMPVAGLVYSYLQECNSHSLIS